MISRAFLAALDQDDPDALDGERIRVRFDKEAGRVLTFTVQYETPRSDAPGEHYPVVRYDTAHQRPHRDVLNEHGETIEDGKTWLKMTYNDALTYAIADITRNWQTYRDAFYRRRK